MIDPLYTREHFEDALTSLRQQVQARGAKITMKSVMENLLRTPGPWSSEAFAELLRGVHGAERRAEAVDAVCCGFEVTWGYYRSLVSACIVYNKLELLAAVAALGLPDVVAQGAGGGNGVKRWRKLAFAVRLSRRLGYQLRATWSR